MIALDKKILLGSGSPRRQFLLKVLGITYRVAVSNIPEIPSPGLQKGAVALYLAEEKANALKTEIQQDEILITADTIVCLGSEIIGKPSNEKEAFQFLSMLNNKNHQVYTGVCLMNHNFRKTILSESIVTFRNLSDEEMKSYIHSMLPMDKAGAYGAQECLPEEMNPCSLKEMEFIDKHNLHALLAQTRVADKEKKFSFIQRISGGYFNVMGFPIVEITEELSKWPKE